MYQCVYILYKTPYQCSFISPPAFKQTGDRIRGFVAVCVTFALVLSGLGMVGGQVEDDEIVLRIAVQEDMQTLNPLHLADGWSSKALELIYDRPIHIDSGT